LHKNHPGACFIPCPCTTPQLRPCKTCYRLCVLCSLQTSEQTEVGQRGLRGACHAAQVPPLSRPTIDPHAKASMGSFNRNNTQPLAALRKPVESCSPDQFLKSPALAAGAQIVVPEYAFHLLEPVASSDWPPIRLLFRTADAHLKFVQNLREPSIIAVASASKILLKTARAVLASAVGRQHSFREVLVGARERADLRGADVVFCDSLTISRVRCKRKLHYQLISQECMGEIAAILELFAVPNRKLKAGSQKRKMRTCV
jgi:hypothetical protein